MPSEGGARSLAGDGTGGRTRETWYWPSSRPSAENASDGTTTVIALANPDELAARCWDGGFTVMVRGDADKPIFTIIDRLGRRLELVRLP